MSDIIEIGPYLAGEIPESVSYSFLTIDGDPVFVDGYNAMFQLKRFGDDQSTTTSSASVNGNTATYNWTETDLQNPGVYQALFWVGNQANRFASLPIIFRVKEPIGATPSV